MDIKLFGNRLKELRGNKSQINTVKEILEKTGISLTAQTLGRYEKGDYKHKPDIEILAALAEYYNVSADYLLGRTDVITTDTDINAVCKYTGLSEYAIHYLINVYSEEQRSGHTLIEYIDNMLVNDSFRNVIYNIDELAGQLVLLNKIAMFEKFISNIIKSDKWDINIKKAYLKAISLRYSVTAIDILMGYDWDYPKICDEYENGKYDEKTIDSILSYYSRAIEKRIDYRKYDISQKMIDVISELTSHRRLTDMDYIIELEQIIWDMCNDEEITSEQQNDLSMALMELHNQISEDVEEDDISLNGLTKSNDQ